MAIVRMRFDLSSFPFEAGYMFFCNNLCGVELGFAIHFLHDAKTGHGTINQRVPCPANALPED